MDIKAKVNEIVEKLNKDEKLKEEFKKDPVKAIEKLSGVDIPDDVEDKVIDAVKVKLGAGKLAGAAEGLKKLF